MALARTNVHSEANRRRTEHMGNTIGLLLMARQSEEAQSKATVISVIAMLISIVALVCSGLQAYLEYASFRRSEAPSPAASQLVSPAQSTPVQSPK